MRSHPTLNAGAMADIAFLLLVFFLATASIPNDKGIQQKLPRDCENCPVPPVHDRNILQVFVNKNGEILVNEEMVSLQELKNLAKRFIDNKGQRPNMSESPQQAIISLRNDRETSYKTYVSVLNELIAAYTDLRTAYAKANYNKTMAALTAAELTAVKKAYPQLISEAETR